MASSESRVNQPLTRLVKEVLADVLAVAGGGEGGEDGGCCAGCCVGKFVDGTVPALADVTAPALVADGTVPALGGDATEPALAAGAGGGGDPELVNPVSDEQPAKAVSAIMPAMIVRKLRHSVPSLASGRCPESPRPRIYQSFNRGSPKAA
jgi:hypothetical protein